MPKILMEDALAYHSSGRPGKIEVVPTKPHHTQYDLSLAYTPGVAQPCLKIKEDKSLVYKYTTKGNLVAVISNGTAVLGLGDIGPLAGKPVMEGKGVLFKIFADIDVFDIEIDEKDPGKFIEIVKAIAPTFGAINLEDIKAPECFEIEDKLKAVLDIPVFHDDQHGTAIITGAALLNCLELVGKDIHDIKLFVSGAGAAGCACTKMFVSLGVNPDNVILYDINGILTKDRQDLTTGNKAFATDKDIHTKEEGIRGADVFLGVSAPGVLTREMLLTMADNPIVFAMANPVPEISYEEAVSTRKDIIMATGRSDYPNQVNNVLGFPFIFRGALDVGATTINEEMKIAAAHAIASLAKEYVPEIVNKAYNLESIVFGRDYIIPKPLDPRLISVVSPAVAKAAMKSGVARKPISDWKAYERELNNRLGLDNKLIMAIRNKAMQDPKRVVFADGNNLKVLKAAQFVCKHNIAKPILLGDRKEMEEVIKKNQLVLPDVPIIDLIRDIPKKKMEKLAKILYDKRARKGMTFDEALEKMYNRDYYGSMMVETGEADAFVTGFSRKYADIIRPAIHVVGTNQRFNHIAGMYIMLTKKGPLFLADTTVNSDPSPETLADTTLLVANEVRKFNLEPRVAILSYSNFGAFKGKGSPIRARTAVDILHQNHPELLVDGEMQANYALNGELRMKKYPFNKLGNLDANVLIFPNLSSGNILYKVLQEIGTAKALGPILLGMNKPIHIMQMECSVSEIVNMAAIAVIDAQAMEKADKVS